MYFEEFELGMEWPVDPVEITREEMLAYAHAYDPAPIHADEEHGRNSNFGDIISPGTMAGMLLWKNWLKYRVQGDEFIAGTSCLMEWYKPVMAGDTLHGRAYVHELEDRNHKNGRVCVKIDGYNQNGEHVLSTFNNIIQKKKGTAK